MLKFNSEKGAIEVSTIAATAIIVAIVAAVSVIATVKYFDILSITPSVTAIVPEPKPTITPTPSIAPTPTPEAITDWKTYANKNYGFNFKYPAEFVSADANLRSETLNYLGRFGTTINMLALSKSAYPKNTDLTRADILIAVNKDVSGGEYFFQSADKSQGVPPPEIEKLTLKKTAAINGIVWGMAEKEGAAAGTHSRVRIYHTFQNGTWYEVQLNFWTANDGNIAQVNENNIWNMLESMLSTFSFTK